MKATMMKVGPDHLWLLCRLLEGFFEEHYDAIQALGNPNSGIGRLKQPSQEQT